MFPSEFRGEVNRKKTRVTGLLCGESCMVLTSTALDRSTRVTDRRADGRSHIACYSIIICCRALKKNLRRSGQKSVAALRSRMSVKSEENDAELKPFVERSGCTCSLSLPALTHSLAPSLQLFVSRNASRRRRSTTPAAPPASATRIDVVSLEASR